MAKKSAVLRQKDSERGLDAKLFLGRNGGTKLFDLGKLAQNLNLRGCLYWLKTLEISLPWPSVLCDRPAGQEECVLQAGPWMLLSRASCAGWDKTRVGSLGAFVAHIAGCIQTAPLAQQLRHLSDGQRPCKVVALPFPASPAL